MFMHHSIIDCDFCASKLAEDSLGIKNPDEERVIVADSAFKMQDYNALFVFKQHNPLNLTQEDYKALFSVAQKWFDQVEDDSTLGHSHPMLGWDAMPASGGSQVHAHAHGFLGRGHFMGHLRDYLESSRDFYAVSYPGSDVTQDYVNVHVSLGLALRLGSNVVLTPLDPVTDHELVLAGPRVDEKFAEILFKIHQTYIHQLGIRSWSLGLAWPRSSGLAMLRIGARFEHDISSMNLYLFNSVSSNPYDTIAAFKRAYYDS